MIGFVAIGRNEGERLKACLASLRKAGERIVYVDSGSTDGSLETAADIGAVVVALDDDAPFTAARARNAGFAELTRRWPDVTRVFFIDGDCELAEGFPAAARAEFDARPNAGIVVGRVRERARDATIYNLVCDMEWAGPAGEIDACGGIFMVRREAFEAAGGFNPAVIAAEDDEFCVRVRGVGWKIYRIANDMCFHDAAMTRFGQWWRRAVRAGHAYAQVGVMHEGYFAGERRRAFLWGLVLPGTILAAAPFTGGWSLVGLFAYPLSWARNAMRLAKEGASVRDAAVYAAFLVLSKFPNLLGILSYRRKVARGRDVAIIEYK